MDQRKRLSRKGCLSDTNIVSQVLESKEAGAAGILGCICSVLGSKAALISSYAAALGLEAPVEVRYLSFKKIMHVEVR